MVWAGMAGGLEAQIGVMWRRNNTEAPFAAT
jgi:hypothetical protein